MFDTSSRISTLEKQVSASYEAFKASSEVQESLLTYKRNLERNCRTQTKRYLTV